MKKVLSVLLAGILVFPFAGCNKEDNGVRPDITGQLEENVENKEDAVKSTEQLEEDIENEEDAVKSTEQLEEDIENEEDVVNKINMKYGDDEVSITLYKPDDAFFSVDSEDALDAGDIVIMLADDSGDIVIMLADDYSWDAEIMGYKHFEGIGSNEPFVEYYFDGAVSDNYASYEQEITDLGIDYEGKPVKLIRYTYKDVGDEEEYKGCFVGFEYKGTDDSGLFGLKIGLFDEELSDSYIKGLFNQMFTCER